jgi:type VI protein secretion system component Hcp
MAENARLFLLLTAPSGAIRGESRVADKRDWIDIDDWSWKLDPSANKDDPEAIRPSVLSFTKTMDRATTAMLTAMAKGTVMTAAIQLDDASRSMFDLSLRFDKVRLVDYEVSTEIGDKSQSVQETWTFDYASVLFEYRADTRSGAMQVRLNRPPGSSTRAPDDREQMFRELSQDMSVQDLNLVWNRMKEVRENSADVKKVLEARKSGSRDRASPGAGPE